MAAVSVSSHEFPQVWRALNTLESFNNGPQLAKPVRFHESWGFLLQVAEDQLAACPMSPEEEEVFFDGEEAEQQALAQSKNLEAADEIVRAFFMSEHRRPRVVAHV